MKYQARNLDTNADTPTLHNSMQSIPSSQMPVFVVREKADAHQIAFNLYGEKNCDYQAYLSSDQKRLTVVAKKTDDATIEEFLWIFALPKNIDVSKTLIDTKGGLFLIQVPKTLTSRRTTQLRQSCLSRETAVYAS